MSDTHSAVATAMESLKSAEAAPAADPAPAPVAGGDQPESEGAASPAAPVAEGAAPPEPATPPAPAAPEPDAPATDAPATDEEAELAALEAELLGEKPELKKGKISASRHQAVLTRARRAAEKALKAAVEEASAKYKKYDVPGIDQDLQILDLVRKGDFNTFVELMSRHQDIWPLVESRFKPKATPAGGEPPAEMPEPNVVMADGSMGYDAKGARQVAEFVASQQTKELREMIEGLRKQLNPLAEERKTRETRAQALERVNRDLDRARTEWEGFKEHEEAIQKYWYANKDVSLHQAYIAVVPKLLRASEADVEKRIREKLLKEAQAGHGTPQRAPVNGAAPAPVAAAAEADENPTRSIIANIARTLR